MNLSVSGLPAIVIQVGFVVVFAAPVWLGARVVGADNPTMLRSAFALILGTVGAFTSAVIGGVLAIILVPLSFLLAFKYVLGTSFLGAIVLGLLTVAGYAAMVHFIGSGFSATETGVGV